MSDSCPPRPIIRTTMSSIPSFCSIIGASYRIGTVLFSMTHSRLTLQNSAILAFTDSSIGSSDLHTMISGKIPAPISSFTECCVGFDLCSPDDLIYGTRVTWMKRQSSLAVSWLICLMASRNGCDSMSPMVPPISVITTSAPVLSPRAYMKDFISFVTCGMICTVDPRYSPFLSFCRTFQKVLPDVRLENLLRSSSMKRS